MLGRASLKLRKNLRKSARSFRGTCLRKKDLMADRVRVSDESVKRMLAFAAILAAIENHDEGRMGEARRSLRALGIVVSIRNGGGR